MSRPIVTDLKKLVKDYQSGKSARELAIELGTSTGVITKWLDHAGVKRRSLSASAKLKLQRYGHPSLGRKHTKDARRKMRENHADVSGPNNPRYKGKGQFAEDGAYLTRDGNGYLRRYAPDHPLASKDGLIGEHVYRACIKWGVKAVRGNDVHHKDGNNGNNSFDNLKILSRSEHMRLEDNLGTAKAKK
jgi:hypothetical protein